MSSGLIPSSFLPHLPRAQNSFSPLSPSELVAHISILRELYLPPIHGGFHAADTFDSDDDDDDDDAKKKRGKGDKKRERGAVAQLASGMNGLGLGFGMVGDSSMAESSLSSIPVSSRTESIERSMVAGGSGGSTAAKLAAGVNGLGLGFGMVNDTSSSASSAAPTPIAGRSGTTTPHAGADVDSDTLGSGDNQSSYSSSSDEEEEETPHLDPFEREWAEKWLSGVVRRSQSWLEENELPDGHTLEEEEGVKEVEAVLRDATAVLAMMAGTSAAGSLTRHLAFPISKSLAPALALQRSNAEPNPALSPETNTFLASLATSPTSPRILRHAHGRCLSTRSDLSSSSPSTTTSLSHPRRHKKRRKPVIPVLLHDAPMGDHLGVGMQTWGSAILLGRRMALRPEDFGLFLPPHLASRRGVRVLELGAGTGLLSILCRKLLDLHHASTASASAEGERSRSAHPGLVVATDFLPNVLDNLKLCVDLNFPPHLADSGKVDIGNSTELARARDEGIHIAKLDWTTFSTFMQSAGSQGEEELAPFVLPISNHNSNLSDTEQSVEKATAFDLVLASDCVYDETHAKLLREVAGWVLRLPDPNDESDQGGTFHILSPLRPTFAPELESIDTYFPPLSTYLPLSQRQAAAAEQPSGSTSLPNELRGEGLGCARGFKLGARGEGKRSVSGRKGEGRVDENGGYWWWEVGWG